MTSPRRSDPKGREGAVATSQRAYRALLRAYPRAIRDEYGDEMARCFRELCREELEGGGLGLAALWARTLAELLCTALKERSTMFARNAYRAAVGVALAAASLLIWLTGAVGIIGSEDNNANSMYFGVLAVGIIGAIIARFRPNGMARALFSTALAQALVAVIALLFGLGFPWGPPGEILGLNGFFVALFVGSALLFRYAAREQPPAGAGQEG